MLPWKPGSAAPMAVLQGDREQRGPERARDALDGGRSPRSRRNGRAVDGATRPAMDGVMVAPSDADEQQRDRAGTIQRIAGSLGTALLAVTLQHAIGARLPGFHRSITGAAALAAAHPARVLPRWRTHSAPHSGSRLVLTRPRS